MSSRLLAKFPWLTLQPTLDFGIIHLEIIPVGMPISIISLHPITVSLHYIQHCLFCFCVASNSPHPCPCISASLHPILLMDAWTQSSLISSLIFALRCCLMIYFSLIPQVIALALRLLGDLSLIIPLMLLYVHVSSSAGRLFITQQLNFTELCIILCFIFSFMTCNILGYCWSCWLFCWV